MKKYCLQSIRIMWHNDAGFGVRMLVEADIPELDEVTDIFVFAFVSRDSGLLNVSEVMSPTADIAEIPAGLREWASTSAIESACHDAMLDEIDGGY